MKRIKNYIKTFTLKSPCDNCIAAPICKEHVCPIEDEYFDKKENVNNCLMKLSSIGVLVILVIQAAGWIFNGIPPKNSGYFLSMCQLTQVFSMCRLMLIKKTKLFNFKKRVKNIDIFELFEKSV